MPDKTPFRPPQRTVTERRRGGDRRSGGDRRGSGRRLSPSAESRVYGFRDFDDRRGGADRRFEDDTELTWSGGRARWPDPVWRDDDRLDDDLLIDVTPDDDSPFGKDR